MTVRYRMTPPESPREREGAGSQQGQDNNLMASDMNHADQKQRDPGRPEQDRDRAL